MTKELIKQLRASMESLPPYDSYPVQVRMVDVKSLITAAEECERLREKVEKLKKQMHCEHRVFECDAMMGGASRCVNCGYSNE